MYICETMWGWDISLKLFNVKLNGVEFREQWSKLQEFDPKTLQTVTVNECDKVNYQSK